MILLQSRREQLANAATEELEIYGRILKEAVLKLTKSFFPQLFLAKTVVLNVGKVLVNS